MVDGDGEGGEATEQAAQPEHDRTQLHLVLHGVSMFGHQRAQGPLPAGGGGGDGDDETDVGGGDSEAGAGGGDEAPAGGDGEEVGAAAPARSHAPQSLTG